MVVLYYELHEIDSKITMRVDKDDEVGRKVAATSSAFLRMRL